MILPESLTYRLSQRPIAWFTPPAIPKRASALHRLWGEEDVTLRNFKAIFGDTKPVIGMVHLGALPGSPLHDVDAGIEGLLDAARKDLEALQRAGFDAVMFGNENDRPYEFAVDTASTATMAFLIGRMRPQITVP